MIQDAPLSNRAHPFCSRLINRNNKKLFYNSIIISASALYSCHVNSAEILMDNLPEYLKYAAYSRIAHFIITKSLPDDPYEEAFSNPPKIEYEDVTDLLNLLEKTSYDQLIYDIIKKICKNIKNYSYTRIQKSEIKKKFNLIINKFPCDKYIQHEGYKIISKAWIYWWEGAQPNKWDDLIDMAQKIINISDRILIFSTLAELLPSSQYNKKMQLIDQGRNLIDTLPSYYERLDRYEPLINACRTFNKPLAIEMIHDILSLDTKYEDFSTINKHKSLIDLAYKIDPELAASIASLADDDPARRDYKEKLHSHLDVLRTKENLLVI